MFLIPRQQVIHSVYYRRGDMHGIALHRRGRHDWVANQQFRK